MVTFMKVDTKCQGKLIIVIVFDLDVFFRRCAYLVGPVFSEYSAFGAFGVSPDSTDRTRDKNIWQVFDRSLCSVRASSRMGSRTLTFDGDPNREGVHVYVV